MTQNPAAQGFDTANSDAKAIALADDVMKAMGGRKAWDRTRFITWNFFGARKHIWDKKTGNVRIEGLRDQSIAIINVNNDTGMIFRNGEKVSHPDSLTKYIKIAKGQWINDSYWLVMPYKLKDSGVTLKYLGDAKTQKDEEAHLLSLTFKEVGNTPQNKYHVWVTKSDNLVKQWAFFQSAANENPGFVLPWENYQKEGKILLSGDRGERKLTDIKVLKKIEGKVMREF
ncbi:MAG TPA: hypothetical protein PKD85_09480 [Saprospiraceae bacterium]|nr:hypothetical protein [Saprospiraceae bacterium]